MKKAIYVLVATTLLFSACKNNDKPSKNAMQSQEMNMKEAAEHNHNTHNNAIGNHSEKMEKNLHATPQKSDAITPIIDSYLEIKNALVNDKKEGAAKGAIMLLDAFSNFDMAQLSKDTHKEFMEIYEDAKEQAEHIVKSPIDHQREHFENLSIDINDLIALLGTNKTLYLSKCPMAGDGKGAIWLSEFKEIKNPFFGSKMLTCGSVQKQLN